MRMLSLTFGTTLARHDMNPRHAAIELAALAGLSAAFLALAPHDMRLFAPLALGFAAYVAWDARARRVWPVPREPARVRMKSAFAVLAWLTLPAALLLYAWGAIQGHAQDLPRSLAGVAAYLPWAYVQQAIFQRYLLGRLHAALPHAPPGALALCNGLAYGLVHLPDPATTALAALAGALWSAVYLRFRVLLPLAASHAVLGIAYYDFALGRSVLNDWADHLLRPPAAP